MKRIFRKLKKVYQIIAATLVAAFLRQQRQWLICKGHRW